MGILELAVCYLMIKDIASSKVGQHVLGEVKKAVQAMDTGEPEAKPA